MRLNGHDRAMIPLRAPLRVFFFGDSICFGQGVSIHRGWVTRLSAQLEALGEALGRQVVVVNSSINGNTTRQALERMPYDVQSHGVDMLLVQFGMNDCNHWQTDRGLPRVSPRGFSANLHEIIDRGLRFGAQQVILNTNHPTSRDDAPMAHTIQTYQQANAAYNVIIREVAAARAGVLLNDIEHVFMQAIGGDREKLAHLLLPDGLHLSPAGHDIYFDRLSPLIDANIRSIVAAPARAA